MTSGRNRITELERNVDELESTVRGLTEELVEANQRIRDLEEAMLAQETNQKNERADAEEAKSEPSEESDTNTGEKRIDDDIIVA